MIIIITHDNDKRPIFLKVGVFPPIIPKKSFFTAGGPTLVTCFENLTIVMMMTYISSILHMGMGNPKEPGSGFEVPADANYHEWRLIQTTVRRLFFH